jgi:hypothetical protein
MATPMHIHLVAEDTVEKFNNAIQRQIDLFYVPYGTPFMMQENTLLCHLMFINDALRVKPGPTSYRLVEQDKADPNLKGEDIIIFDRKIFVVELNWVNFQSHYQTILCLQGLFPV